MLDPNMAGLLHVVRIRELEREARRRRLVHAAVADPGRRGGALRRALGAGLMRLGGWLVGPGVEPAAG